MPRQQQAKTVSHTFSFPIKGFWGGTAESLRPPGTTPSCANVIGRDRNGVFGGSMRWGLSKLFATPLKDFGGIATGRIISMTQAVTVEDGYALRQMAFMAGGQVYACRFGNQPYRISQAVGLALGVGNPSAFLLPTPTECYVIDGTNVPIFFEWATSAASESDDSISMVIPDLPVAGWPAGVAFGTLWRGRMLLSGQPTSPQNVYASSISDTYAGAGAWDTANLAPDGAWTLNASTAGHIGDGVTALIPFTDDTLIIAGRHTLWRLDGDPNAGGSLSLVSPVVGIASQSAWCHDPQGSIYFVGNGAFYRYTPALGQIADLSSARALLQFRAMNEKSNYFNVVFDHANRGVWIFVVGTDAGAIHIDNDNSWFYDIEQDALFPMGFPLSVGPVSAMTYAGGQDVLTDGNDNRAMLIGTFDGRVLKIDAAATTDDGTAISAVVDLEGFQPFGPGQTAKMISCQVTMAGQQVKTNTDTGVTTFADSDWNANVTLLGARTLLDAATNNVLDTHGAAPVSFSQTYTSNGYQGSIMPRISGSYFLVKIDNSTSGKIFACNQIVCQFQAAGRVR